MGVRPEWRYACTAAVALAIGASGASLYVRMAAPYYEFAAKILARKPYWQVSRVDVVPGGIGGAEQLRLTGLVRARADATQPDAAITATLQAAAAVQSPVVFWATLFAWAAATLRRRAALLLLGLPLFACLEAATTVCQLLSPLAQASAFLAGDENPLTGWEKWSRFLESGGRIALALGTALLTVSLVSGAQRRIKQPRAA